jgi:hypothetical protein
MASSFTHDKCNDAQPPDRDRTGSPRPLLNRDIDTFYVHSARQNIQVTQKIADFPLGAMQIVHNLSSTYSVTGMLPVQQ